MPITKLADFEKVANLFKIYEGGSQPSSAIWVETDKMPNEDGIVVLSDEEYNNSFIVPEDNGSLRGQYELYDVTTSHGLVALHPASIQFNDPRVDNALGIA